MFSPFLRGRFLEILMGGHENFIFGGYIFPRPF